MVSRLRGEDASDDDAGVPPERLYRELVDSGVVDATPSREDPALAVRTSVVETLFDGEPFSFEEPLVNDSLEAALVALVALQERDTHGRGLMRGLERVFDAELSPGTVYPQLHDLEDDGLLQGRDLVGAREYQVGDADAARDRVEAAMRQHLAFGFLLQATLEEL